MSDRLPAGWTEVALGDLFDVRYGKALRKRDRVEDGHVGVYGSAGLVGYHDVALVDAPVVVIGRKGNAGAVWVTEQPSWPIDTTYFLRMPAGVLPGFVGYQLSNLKLVTQDSSTTIPSLRRPDLEAVSIKLPPRAEQERIVAAIEDHFARLSAVELTLEGGLRSLTALRTSLMTDAFKLGETLARDWRYRKIGEVAEVQLGRQRSPEHHAGPHMRPYLRAANITWTGFSLDDIKQMNFDEGDLETYRLRPGDLLLNEASGSPNEVGKPAAWNGEIENCCFQNTLLRLQARDIDPGYLYWYCYMAALTGRFGEAGRGVNI